MNMPQNNDDGLPENLHQMSRKELIEYAVSVGWNKDDIKGYGKNKLLGMLVTETPAQVEEQTVEPTLLPQPAPNASEASKKVRHFSPMAIVFGAIRKTPVDGKKIVTGFCSKIDEQVSWAKARSDKYCGVAVTPSGKRHNNKIYIVANQPNAAELQMTEAVCNALDAAGRQYEVEHVESGPVVTLK